MSCQTTGKLKVQCNLCPRLLNNFFLFGSQSEASCTGYLNDLEKALPAYFQI